MDYLSELKPTWRHIDDGPIPKNMKCLWKSDFGAATIGVWYEECQWTYWSPLPSHTAEQKIQRLKRSK